MLATRRMMSENGGAQEASSEGVSGRLISFTLDYRLSWYRCKAYIGATMLSRICASMSFLKVKPFSVRSKDLMSCYILGKTMTLYSP